MILLAGDLHFVPPSDRGHAPADVGGLADEQSLVECLDHLSDVLTDIVLLGDLHDAYVEYRHLVPRGPTRLLGQLARFGDAGVSITYVVGNHDPWHRSFMEQDLGFHLMKRPGKVTLDGVRLHLAHGDLQGQHGWARRIARHRLSLDCYTGLLPGDLGQGLARRVSRRLARRRDDEMLPLRLQEYALRVLHENEVDVVAMGHSHVPAEKHTPAGTYLNPGFWPQHRIVGIVDGGDASLQRWDGRALKPVFSPPDE